MIRCQTWGHFATLQSLMAVAGRRVLATTLAISMIVPGSAAYAADGVNTPPPDPSDDLTVQPAHPPEPEAPTTETQPERGPAKPSSEDAKSKKPATHSRRRERAESPPQLTPQEQEAAAKREAAAKYYDEGRRYYAIGDYLNAITSFERAFELFEAPELISNLGQAYWKRYQVDPNLAHLRRARDLLTKFDQVMMNDPELSQGYNHEETANYIREIELRIRQHEERDAAAEKERLAVSAKAAEEVRQQGPNAQQRAEMRRERANLGMKWGGTVATVVGSLTLLAGGIALATRGGTGLLLDKSADAAKKGANFNSASDDKQQRDIYASTGRVAFATLLAGGILLPVGITLRIVGNTRLKRDDKARDARQRRELEDKCKLIDPKLQMSPLPQPAASTQTSTLSWRVGVGSLFRVEF